MNSIKPITILITLFSFYAYSQNGHNFDGSWFSSSGYGMSMFVLKANGDAKWFASGCVIQNETHIGTWVSSNDTAIVYVEKDTILLILTGNRLRSLPIDSTHDCESCGLSKTWRKTKFGANQKWGHENRKRRRQSNREFRRSFREEIKNESTE